LKATQLKQSRTDAETQRALSGLRNGGSTAGLGTGMISIDQPGLSLEAILASSEALEPSRDGDAIQVVTMGQSFLEKMPKADQPAQLRATLLPYQLQVCDPT
jgi:hypothetical protein